MSDLDEMNCDEMADVAAELALGVLTGRERTQAIAHLDRCEACRENVRQLTETGEGLLGLLPASEPPARFETRVMGRLGLAAPRPKGTRRMLAVAAVALAAVACGLGGWGLRGATVSGGPGPLGRIPRPPALPPRHRRRGHVAASPRPAGRRPARPGRAGRDARREPADRPAESRHRRRIDHGRRPRPAPPAADPATHRLTSHLAHEEAGALPLISQTMTPRELGRIATAIRGGTGAWRLGSTVPWALAGAAPDLCQQVRRQLPAPARLLCQTLWVPRYTRSTPPP